MKVDFPEPLNSLISGPENKAITNFYGAPGTGKTNFCLFAALDCIRKGGTVVFIDTEGGLSLERIKQLASDHEAVLSRMKIIEPKSFEEQGRIIRKLDGMEADMIIVDSMVALYRLEYSEEMKKHLTEEERNAVFGPKGEKGRAGQIQSKNTEMLVRRIKNRMRAK